MTGGERGGESEGWMGSKHTCIEISQRPLMYTIDMHNNYNKQYEEKCYNVIITVITIKHSE